MTSPVGAQYVFFEPSGPRVNISLTLDGSNLAAPQPGATNIEIFTATPGSLAPGYIGSAFASGADIASAGGFDPETDVFGPSSMQLLAGNYAVADISGNNSISLGSGNQSVIGAARDSIVGGSGAGFIDATAGLITVQIGSSGGSDNIFSGQFDTIRGGADAATIIGAAGDTLDL